VASTLTRKDVDDASQAGPLLDQVAVAVHALNRMLEPGRPSYVRVA